MLLDVRVCVAVVDSDEVDDSLAETVDDAVPVTLAVCVSELLCDCVGVGLQPTFDARSRTPPYVPLVVQDAPALELATIAKASAKPDVGA